MTLPDTLSTAVCREFGPDPDRYAAPAASAQTLADSASAFRTELETPSGSRTVGLPLLVHRRCAKPMFGVANAAAYAGLMVNARGPKPSRWLHVEGGGQDKWCEEEGEAAVRMLGTLAAAGVGPDLYVVSPFRLVAQRLRELIRERGILKPVFGRDEARRWVAERLGTVHTAQGREAEAVILVLGAPLPAGARGWAGGRPNLLNVAVTRAKEAVYVIGNRDLWRQAGVFAQLAARLPAGSAESTPSPKA